MQNTTRTTIRIRKDLLDQSRLLALAKGTSLQDVINETLAIGYQHVTDIGSTREAMRHIDNFRQHMEKKKINVKKLLDASKTDQK
jgi:hypothetical protein